MFRVSAQTEEILAKKRYLPCMKKNFNLMSEYLFGSEAFHVGGVEKMFKIFREVCDIGVHRDLQNRRNFFEIMIIFMTSH